jgi:hypothetical protein
MVDPMGNNPIYACRISMSDNQINYSRRIYSVLDLLGDIGGIQGALQSVGFILLSAYADSLFALAVANENFEYIDPMKG